MPDERVWSAEELLAMSPEERHALVTAGIVTDLTLAPVELLEQAQTDIESHAAER